MLKEPTATYTRRYGGLGEVLEGEGEIVDAFENLYPCENALIALPRVIGIHQHLSLDGEPIPRELETRMEEIGQEMLGIKGMRDDISGTLICLVYDSDIFRGDSLRSMVSGKDVLNRLRLASYNDVPEFTAKPLISSMRVGKLLEDLKKDKTKATALTLLEREAEYFQLNCQNYGLTRIEAMNYGTLARIVRKIKEPVQEEGEESNLITNPEQIKAICALRNLLNRLKPGKDLF